MPNKSEDIWKLRNNLPMQVAITRRRLLQLGGATTIALVTQDWWQKSSQAAPPPIFEFQAVIVDSTGQIIDRRPGQAEFFTENLGTDLSLDMVKIPGGNFQMGSPTTEAGRKANESPQHLVNISPFYLGKYVVTQEQYQAVMGNNPAELKGAKRPVEQVSWGESREFCQKLAQKTGKNYRLPSEAEWEYACRAGTTTPFHFGETITPELVNYNGEFPYGQAPQGLNREVTTNVGTFPPNAFGLYDMHGNVWEWCSDAWHDNYTGAPTDGSSWEVWTSVVTFVRVLRGGSWSYYAANCRSADRLSYPAFSAYGHIGFRVALTLV
jgi:formylglycine-generating enzyme required for sulfatase activity